MFYDFVITLHKEFICSLPLKIKGKKNFANDSHLENELIII
tara:strand:+ start:614 stop:736 length:123 start_codon:yes stop_codon:yes gene_type:complete